jgi:hypothetical protein
VTFGKEIIIPTHGFSKNMNKIPVTIILGDGINQEIGYYREIDCAALPRVGDAIEQIGGTNARSHCGIVAKVEHVFSESQKTHEVRLHISKKTIA